MSLFRNIFKLEVVLILTEFWYSNENVEINKSKCPKQY